MALIVMKFGGSSVADSDKMKLVANKIIARKKGGNKIVVVVSAPGDTTDELITKCEEITADPNPREMDMLLATGEQMSIALLAMTILSLGHKAVSLTGFQAGITTNDDYTKARVKKIDPKKIFSFLDKGNIVVVAGFQGMNKCGDITTLGRGGSDLTAVALAAILKANMCEIYSDVEGIFTTDPRVVKDARKIDLISYEEMLEMAGSGAQVMQTRSIEVAKNYGIEIHARSTFSEQEGTFIVSEEKIGRKKMEDLMVSAVTFDKNQVKFSLIDLPDVPGMAAKIFSSIAKLGINVDMIIQSAALDKKNDISFTVSKIDMKKTQQKVDELAKELGAQTVTCDEHVAKVSVVGVGMKTHAGVASKMFDIFAKNKINIEMISTSEIKVSCVIDAVDLNKAVNELHKGFKLNKK